MSFHLISPRGDDLVLIKFARMCVSKSEGHGSFFRLQVSEMSENISLKMGVKFAASLNMGKNLCQLLNVITYKNGENELQFT